MRRSSVQVRSLAFSLLLVSCTHGAPLVQPRSDLAPSAVIIAFPAGDRRAAQAELDGFVDVSAGIACAALGASAPKGQRGYPAVSTTLAEGAERLVADAGFAVHDFRAIQRALQDNVAADADVARATRARCPQALGPASTSRGGDGGDIDSAGLPGTPGEVKRLW